MKLNRIIPLNRIYSYALGFMLLSNIVVIAQDDVNPIGLGLQSNLIQIPLTEQSVQVHQSAVYLLYRFNNLQLNAGLQNAIQLNNVTNVYESANGLIVGANYYLPFKWKKTPTAFHLSWILELDDIDISQKNQLNFGVRQYVSKHCFIGTGLYWLQRNRINAGQGQNWFWQLGLEL